LSTTFRLAVWLLRTISFGLESTRVLPKASSSLMVLVIDPPAAAFGLLYVSERNELLRLGGASGSVGVAKLWRIE
jgi:hypothetical protein